MKINWIYLAKAYFIPTTIIIASLALLTTPATQLFGPAFGTFTAYVVQATIVMIALWFSRKAQKAIEK